ncbi:mechanosensitive ion channel family protein [Kangiella aquimarina]|uniref:Mechanosensitive ion channel n=1 Tax=Kangiella aquimarina TaxID=261965 RepID=A0ABZ0X1W0_9GAMM|nr:mechanosensitive ion channel domain-containing protein [Kangiella aquimarina]WQG84505.1 mechanosensitive ion channel [Kangiella aquimarina]
MSKPLISLKEGSSINLWQLLLALLFVIIAWLVSRFVAKFIGRKILKMMNISDDNVIIIQRLVFFVMLGIIVITVLSFLNVPLTAFAFISGAIAIGVGFGAKNVMDNFISGWILMSERPVRINDVVEMDSQLGRVIQVGNRSTMIRRIDGAHMVIPNSTLLQSNLINWTLVDPNIRNSIKVGVAYGSDVEKVRDILFDILSNNENVLKDPEPSVIFEDFGDSALLFEVWYWAQINTIRELRGIRSDLRFEIDKKFRENDIVIAFPQRDVHLHFADDVAKQLAKKLESSGSQQSIEDKSKGEQAEGSVEETEKSHKQS